MDEKSIARLIRGASQIRVSGKCLGSVRQKMAEEAIAFFQKNSVNPQREEYFGVKQYAGFGDQREDHEPGYGPKYGSIVFLIDYKRSVQNLTIDDDGIFLLTTVVANPNTDIGDIIADYEKAIEDVAQAKQTLLALVQFDA